MKLGYARRNITPKPGITLSGFASRCNAPSTGIADPIFVKAILFENDGASVLMLSFDLLALGPELDERLQAALDNALGSTGQALPTRDNRIFVCTHTHSAPATINLLGCGISEPAYWSSLVEKSVEAAVEASRRRVDARMRLAQVALPGSNYNRHSVLDDGRVVMGQFPQGKVVRRGPDQESMHILRFEDADGIALVAMLFWAAHPCTLGGLEISGDFPGLLCSRLEDTWRIPVVFLQGACGDLNPPFSKMNREEMTANCDAIISRLSHLRFSHGLNEWPFGFIRTSLRLPYLLGTDTDSIRRFHDGMAEIARTGSGPEASIAVLTNILNVEAGKTADPKMMRYIADCMRMWSGKVLTQATLPVSCELALSIFRMGHLVFVAIAAEVFQETARSLQAANPDDRVIVLGYASPLVGYLPTAQCQADGGYETDWAWRFYDHPGPFVAEAEERTRGILETLIRQTATSRPDPVRDRLSVCSFPEE